MKKSKTNQIKNENVKKRGTFTIVFAVLFVAVVILVNFFSTSLAQKLPTTIDLTADKTGTLTVENVDFIKSIENTGIHQYFGVRNFLIFIVFSIASS